jgi:hypothetical protein
VISLCQIYSENALFRIRFGSNNLFVFLHPIQASKLKKSGRVLQDITFEFAQNEIAKHSGLDISNGIGVILASYLRVTCCCYELVAENALLQEEVMSMHQMVQDANAMAEDMQKDVKFSIMLLSAEARGLDRGSTEVLTILYIVCPSNSTINFYKVQVCMLDERSGNEFQWTKAKFLNRQVHMQEMYQKFDETNEIPDIPKVVLSFFLLYYKLFC